jgi:hypothetical protein
MKRSIVSLWLAFACGAAIAAPEPAPSPCLSDPHAVGLRTRIEKMRDQVTRVQVAQDSAAQRRGMALHAKLVSEGLTELRRREPELRPGCRLEILHSLMEQMVAHQATAYELDDR